MPVIDSTTKTYYIYALVNPLNDSVFYVGATANPKQRMISHYSCGYAESNIEKCAIIKNIRDAGLRPAMKIIDTLVTDDVRLVNDIEATWIEWHLKAGIPITNLIRTRFYPDADAARLLRHIKRLKKYAELPRDQRIHARKPVVYLMKASSS